MIEEKTSNPIIGFFVNVRTVAMRKVRQVVIGESVRFDYT